MAGENIAVTTLRLAPLPDALRPRKSLPPQDARTTAAAGRKLAEAGAGRAPLIAVFFGSKQPSGVWPYPRVRDFLALLPERFPGFRFAILGGPHERAAVDRLKAEAPGLFPPLLDLVDRLTLPETAAVMARCRAAVATDSGPMHMADALGVPLVALFGAKNPLPLWAPLSPGARVVTHPVPCAGCLKSVCDRDNLCMDLITPQEALAALAEVMGG
jgi:heptosyltransferase-2